MIFIFYVLSAVLIFFSYRSFRGGIDYLNYFKKELAKPPSRYSPFASVIVPCKGLDEGLSENLLALLEQDYPAYEVIFVVDDEADPAVAVIEAISSEYRGAKLVVAQNAADSSQKVENLREAVLHVADDSRIFVFVDSDTRPSPDWLRHLVEPLADEDIGAATGYRWFVSNRPTFASEMRSVWNASIASALGPNMKSNFCWGGSTAIRRDVFDRLEIRRKWSGTLSDDLTLTNALSAAKLPIYFVPRALTATIEACSFSGLLEFTNRQMKITRVYAPHLWKLSFFGSTIFNVVIMAAFLILIFDRIDAFAAGSAGVTIAAVSIFSIGKSWLRLAAVRSVLRNYEKELAKQSLTQNTLWLAAPALFMVNCLAATFSQTIKWRGTLYEMISAEKTVIKRK